MDVHKSVTFAFQFVKKILQTSTLLIKYRASESQFWSIKYTTAGYAKISSVSMPSHQLMQVITMRRLDENEPLENTFKHI